MAMNTGLRSCASKLTNSAMMPKSVKRSIHSTSVKKMGGGRGHDEPIHSTSSVKKMGGGHGHEEPTHSTSVKKIGGGHEEPIHSTSVKEMGGGHGHGHGHDEPFYMHAKHMYNLDMMKYQKFTMTLAVFTAFSIGVSVPIYAVVFQQRKASSA